MGRERGREGEREMGFLVSSPLPTTYYLLPTTHYLLPTTCYLLPATCYLLTTNN